MARRSCAAAVARSIRRRARRIPRDQARPPRLQGRDQTVLVSLLEIQQTLRRPGMKTYKMYVNNEFVGAAGTREIVNPATGETLAVVPEAGKKDVDKAV